MTSEAKSYTYHGQQFRRLSEDSFTKLLSFRTVMGWMIADLMRKRRIVKIDRQRRISKNWYVQLQARITVYRTGKIFLDRASPLMFFGSSRKLPRPQPVFHNPVTVCQPSLIEQIRVRAGGGEGITFASGPHRTLPSSVKIRSAMCTCTYTFTCACICVVYRLPLPFCRPHV